jgi:DNA-binding NtrC family response regulator
VLIADDDPMICDVLGAIASSMGHDADIARTATGTVEAVAKRSYDIALLDIQFPDCADLSTLSKIREISPATDVIMVTASTDDLDVVAEAVRLGAFDYVPKPIREDDIKIRVTRLLKMRSLARSRDRAIAELSRGREIRDIVGETLAIKNVIRQARELAAYDVQVLVTGETGTGKELVARALHYGGPRREKPFVSINCAAVPRELCESELFGHEKGAFTGASAVRAGAFEEAQEGTLFLDEIGDMDLTAQASLLHVLESGEYRSVGGKAKRSAARLVIATNQDLGGLIRDGRFRKDLFYRINRAHVELPPLRSRVEDVPLLARHFLRELERRVSRGVRGIAEEALSALRGYAWPGNVRELKNEIERAYLRTEGDTIGLMDLSPEIAAQGGEPEGTQVDAKTVEEFQRLADALRESGGNVSKAAELLGVHRNTVHRWMRRHALQRR